MPLVFIAMGLLHGASGPAAERANVNPPYAAIGTATNPYAVFQASTRPYATITST